MRFLSIKKKFFISFGIMLLLICGMGAFTHSQFAIMAQLNRFTNSDVLPGVAVGGRLDGEIADMRVAEAEHMLTADPALRVEAENSLPNSKKRIAIDLKGLRATADTNEERRISSALDVK